MSPVSVGTKKSGWCIQSFHETCIWKGCSCSCHQRDADHSD